MDLAFLRFLRAFGMVEGVSTLFLFFVAMPMKYLGDMPMAVTIAGSIHGFLFLGLVVLFFVAIQRVPISHKLAIAGVVGAVVPFGPFVVDHWLKKVAHAAVSAPAPE